MPTTDLDDLKARVSRLSVAGPFITPGGPTITALLRDLLTYATTVTQERDEQREAAQSIMSDLRCELEMEQAERSALTAALSAAEQERDAAIASAQAASQRAQHLDTIRRAIARSPENCPVCHSPMVEHVPGCIAAFDHAQPVDPPSLLGRRCFECPGTIVAACNRCGQKYATPIAQETP